MFANHGDSISSARILWLCDTLIFEKTALQWLLNILHDPKYIIPCELWELDILRSHKPFVSTVSIALGSDCS